MQVFNCLLDARGYGCFCCLNTFLFSIFTNISYCHTVVHVVKIKSGAKYFYFAGIIEMALKWSLLGNMCSLLL
jgi:hypothetical protein